MAIYDSMAIQPGNVRYGNIAFAIAGQIVDLYFHEIISAEVETAAINFGTPVNYGTGSMVTELADGTDITGFKGIAVRELAREMDIRGAQAVTKYNVGAVAGIMRKGHIYVALADDSAADAVIGAGVFTNGGLFYGTTAGASADGLVAIPNATYETAGTAGDIVEIRLA